MMRAYFKAQHSLIILFCSVILFLPFVQFLYNMPVHVVVYALLIISFVFCIIFVRDGIRFWVVHERLNLFLTEMDAYEPIFPKPRSIIEEDYVMIIERLYKQIENVTIQMETKSKEQMDYYTMWVHQIKTPVSVINLMLEAEENIQMQFELEQELFKIERYIEMALEYIRIDHIQNDISIEVFQIEEEVKKVVRKYANVFISKKLNVELEFNDDLVCTDRKWFGFIIGQFLSNSLKYTNEGVIKLYMESERVMVIEDSGIGIIQEDQRRIFDKGFTGYNGRVDKKSSGIGLYLCKKVGLQLGLVYQVESQLDKGTKMKIIFPKKNIWDM